MEKTWEGINNVLARKLKNTKPSITFVKDPNDNDSVPSDLLLDINWPVSYQPFSVIMLIL